MSIGESLGNMLSTAISVLPKLIVFVIILVVGWIVARLLARVVDRLLERVGFDRLIERSGVQRWLGSYDPSELFSKLVYYAVLLFTLQLAFGVFGPNPVSDIINAIVGFLPLVFVALLIVVIAAAIGGAVKDIITSSLGGLSYGRILGTLAQVFIVAIGVIAALNQVGIATTVTTPVLIAVLATIGGVVVVGIGGGLIQPMRERWERMLNHAENEAGNVKAQMDANATHRRQTFAQHQYESSQYRDEYSSQSQTVRRPARPGTAEYRERGQSGQSRSGRGGPPRSGTYRSQSYGQ